MRLETIIGLEIHVELATKSKIFCNCSTVFGGVPNENTCPICTGLPGTLPVLNEETVKLAITAGKALNCEINLVNKFDRKHYFYPDLPKAYQISQFDIPLCKKGYMEIDLGGNQKIVNITRVHMEEDAGKLIHLENEPVTLVDYNRAGVPLIEIVTAPELRSPEEAVTFLKSLKTILQYTGVSDCKMQEGSLRCDVNISLRQVGQETYNTRVEIKNLNSFREVLKALKQEEKRQRELYLHGKGDTIQQETRRWDENKQNTVIMRKKEESQDYRYFLEPDLGTLVIEESMIQGIEDNLPEFPRARRERILKQYGIKEDQADLLIREKHMINYFEAVVTFGGNPLEISNWITVELFKELKGKGEEVRIPIKPKYLAELIKMVQEESISRPAGKLVLKELLVKDKSPAEIVGEKDLEQISDVQELETIAFNIITENPQAVEDYKKGKAKAVGYLVGQVMKATKGQGNPQLIKEIIEKEVQK
ncbi:MAG: Asp-tRNA(Asn)/Glu-tRNA(Gln) amidotransferase subunit GatB [Clostridiaceae bacterium]|nr:Asp-tRNA(Asn)/Glu-tRNA(Gln) amidotransferase subunit GatB [Clostridiaceae bacterium]